MDFWLRPTRPRAGFFVSATAAAWLLASSALKSVSPPAPRVMPPPRRRHGTATRRRSASQCLKAALMRCARNSHPAAAQPGMSGSGSASRRAAWRVNAIGAQMIVVSSSTPWDQVGGQVAPFLAGASRAVASLRHSTAQARHARAPRASTVSPCHRVSRPDPRSRNRRPP